MKAKNGKITLSGPSQIGDLRFKHLDAYILQEFMERGHKPDVHCIVKFISKFYGIVEPLVYTLDYDDLKKEYGRCINLFKGFGLRKPKKEITVEGVTYQLVNMKRPSAGWVADCDLSDFENDPVRLACICYIPKGTNYGDVDEHLNLLHPIESRHEIFKEHFPLEEYLHLSGFFLSRFVKLQRRYMAVQKAKMRGRRLRKTLILGWKRLTQSAKNIIFLGTK